MSKISTAEEAINLLKKLKADAMDFDRYEYDIFDDYRQMARVGLRELIDTLVELEIPEALATSTVTQQNAQELYYIENDVNERGSCRISGYFSTFDKAQEALKSCCDWYCSKGTGKIYRVDMDTLDPNDVLVCTNGVIEPEFLHKLAPQPIINPKSLSERMSYPEEERALARNTLESIIATAQSISEQSAKLTGDLKEHKSNFERW